MSSIREYQRRFEKAVRPLVLWLRANPLGPALTVCLAGLISIFALPQLTVWLVDLPKLVMTEVLLSAPFVPYAVYRVHRVPWKPLAGLWGAIYVIALATPPAPLKLMHGLAISAHFTGWFLWGFVITAAWAWFLNARSAPVKKTESVRV